MTNDLLKRLLQPPFGTETSERNLMAEAAVRILELEAARPSVEPVTVHSLPSGKWCDCGLPHETGGPCWECRAIAGEKP